MTSLPPPSGVQVHDSLTCTELALRYLNTLANLHRAVTGKLEIRPSPCELRAIVQARSLAPALLLALASTISSPSSSAATLPAPPPPSPPPSPPQMAVTVVRPQLQPGVEIRLELPPHDVYVEVDQVMLTQATAPPAAAGATTTATTAALTAIAAAAAVSAAATTTTAATTPTTPPSRAPPFGRCSSICCRTRRASPRRATCACAARSVQSCRGSAPRASPSSTRARQLAENAFGPA